MALDPRVNLVTSQIIGAAIEVHRHIGPGLLESTYMRCLQFELAGHNLHFAAQLAVPILYKGIHLDANYRIDLLVEGLVVVEVKSLDHLLPVHQAQVLTYMRIGGCPAGLLINFNVPRLIDGVKRLINSPPVDKTDEQEERERR
jgi:GxxExxY protein